MARNFRALITAVILFFAFCECALSEIGWPVWPDSLVHNIGNNYGQFNCLSFPCVVPTIHQGIDIMVPPGTPVYAVRPGYVKTIRQTEVIIGDSAGLEECDAWIYVHLIDTSINIGIGDYIEAGQYVGAVHSWNEAEFHHLHFAKIRHYGDSTSWNDNLSWQVVTNPLDELQPLYDPDPPIFEDAFEDQSFAFAVNYGDTYFPQGATLSGNVDIVCRVYDYTNDYEWKLIPYQIEYRIEGDTVTPWINSFCFNGTTERQANLEVIYRMDSICASQGDYFIREFYFNVTNTDGDSIVEASDAFNSWQTQYFHNGEYTIHVQAGDKFGNSTTESMTVSVENFFDLDGTVTLENLHSHGGTIVTVASSGQSDTTDFTGQFYIANVAGGSQTIEVRHSEYEAIDTVVMMSQNRTLDLTLQHLYKCGDANNDSTVNILDITFLINYLYKGGPAPEFLEACNANGDDAVNILDITYLIAYLYKGGPKPECI